jgi:hypothetical protein
VGPKDGSRDQVRKEQDVSEDRLRQVFRRESLPVDVDEVSDQGEADKGNAERQRHIQDAGVDPEEEPEYVAIDEVGIFENRKRQQQHDDGDSGMPPAIRRIRRRVDPAAAEIGDRHQDEWNPEIFKLPLRIEKCAARDDEPEPILPRNCEMQCEIDGKEHKKCGCAKYQDIGSIRPPSNGTCRTESRMLHRGPFDLWRRSNPGPCHCPSKASHIRR